MKKTSQFMGLLAGLVVAGVVGCSDGGDEAESESEGSGGGSSSEQSGACAADQAGQPCDDACSFEPSGIDCMAACENIAEKCAAAECDSECTGLNQDVDTCKAACEGTKALNCTNETFACWASESTCEGVGTCFQDATQSAGGDGDGDSSGDGDGDTAGDGDGTGGTQGDGDGDGDGGMTSGPGIAASVDGVAQDFDNNIAANKYNLNGWIVFNGENAAGDKIDIGFSGGGPGSYVCPDDNSNMSIKYYQGVSVKNSQGGQASCALEVTEVGEVGGRIKGTFEVTFDSVTITNGSFDVERGEDL